MATIELITSWLTPTTLFLLLNLMIGTIAIISHLGASKNPNNHHQHQLGHHYSPPLARAPSLIDRVKSINLSLYKFPSPDHGYEHFDEPRAPSLLERVKSIEFSHFKFSHYTDLHQPTHHEYVDRDRHDSYTPVHTDRVDSSSFVQNPPLLERVKSINFSEFFKFPHYTPETHFHQLRENESENTNSVDDPPKLVRAPSIMDRVKSIKLPSIYRSEQLNPETDFPRQTEPITQTLNQYPGSKSSRVREQKPKRKTKEETTKKAASEKMTKSASTKPGTARFFEEETVETVEKRRPETMRVQRTSTIGDGDLSVDAKADDFINKFKAQLKLQRLDSVLRNKDTKRN